MRLKRLAPFAAVAVMALSVQAAGAGSAVAATSKSGGSAASSAQVLSLKVRALNQLSHTIEAVNATLSATTLTSPFAARINVVPITADGVKHGEQTITQGNKSVGPVNQSFTNVVQLSSPALVLKAAADTKQAVATLTSNGLSGASLLGIQLPAFTSTLGFGSSVVDGVSDASKGVTVKGLQLPTLTQLLNALGIPLGTLTTQVLNALVNGLDLVTGTITTATTAVNNAQATYDAAQSAYAAGVADVTAKTTALTNALVAGNAILNTIPVTASDWQNLTGLQQSTLLSALGLLGGGPAAVTAISNASSALTLAQNAIAGLLAAVNTALGILNTLTTTLRGRLTRRCCRLVS
jgi:hypothetical protein